jgi:hypothetical protein
MRLATLLIVGLLTLATSARAAEIRTLTGPTLAATTVVADAVQNPPAKTEVDISVNHGHGRWYASPVWIAIGVLALIVVILLIILAARSGGGGTTIVRG